MGSAPGGDTAVSQIASCNAVALDAINRTASLRGPKGNVVVLPARDPEQFRRIAVGDPIEAKYVEAVALGVTPVQPAVAAAIASAPKPLSVFLFLWGAAVDGDFSVTGPRTGTQAQVALNASAGDS